VGKTVWFSGRKTLACILVSTVRGDK